MYCSAMIPPMTITTTETIERIIEEELLLARRSVRRREAPLPERRAGVTDGVGCGADLLSDTLFCFSKAATARRRFEASVRLLATVKNLLAVS